MTQAAASGQTLTLLACQISIPPMTTATERDAHLHRSATCVLSELETAESPVDLVVLPELSSIDYSRATFAHLDAIAEMPEGASFQTWRKVARERGVHVCYGFARAGEGGPYICMAVVNPDGDLVGTYDKLHLAQYGASMEKEYFSRGKSVFVFDVKGFTLSPIICYDIRIPELSRALAVEYGVDAILHCGAYYRDESFHTWHAFAITRAIENQVYFLSLNRAGKSYGNSLFCPPWQDEDIRPLEFAKTDEDFRIITLDKAILRKTRRDYPFLNDRLETYTLGSGKP